MSGLDTADVRAALRSTGATHLHVASFFLLPLLASGLPTLLAEVRAEGITVSLDTNWDPAEKWEGVVECLPFVDVLLPNAAEAAALAEAAGARTADAIGAAQALAAFGPIVAVKDGAAGGFAVTQRQVARARGLELDVVDTTGAGDSFDAGFLAAWLAGEPLDRCIRAAAVAGSLSTRAPGGTGSQATAPELTAHSPRDYF